MQTGILESDYDNRNFSGASNPDDLLTVKFYEEAVQNNYLSEKEGQAIYEPVVMISISTPGQALLNEVHRRKTLQDEARFPRQWRFYEITHSNDPEKMGTPLAQWPLLNVATVANLKALQFFTVEQVAGASDEQIQRIGMHGGGMSPLSLRDQAKRFLQVARNSGAANQQAEELKKRDEIIAQMQQQMAELAAKVNAVEEKPKRTMSPEHKAALAAGRAKAKGEKEGQHETVA